MFWFSFMISQLHSSKPKVKQNIMAEGVEEECSSGYGNQEAEKEFCSQRQNINPRVTSLVNYFLQPHPNFLQLPPS